MGSDSAKAPTKRTAGSTFLAPCVRRMMTRSCLLWPKVVQSLAHLLVDVDTLACLDFLVWLRTGDEVAKRLSVNQSTISRNFRKCCKEFSLISGKVESEYSVSGDLGLLNLGRKVHQSHRWQGGAAFEDRRNVLEWSCIVV